MPGQVGSAVGSAEADVSTGRTDAVVEVVGLTKRFGKRTVLHDVSFTVPRGVGFGVLGPNGAGKTTLLRTLLGLVGYSAGSIRIFGKRAPLELPSIYWRVGAVVDEPGFLPHLTGRQTLEMLATARGDGASKRIDAALERVGLGPISTQRVSRYSTGMRQRLGVATCLIADPELLILDESMNGLDPLGMQELRALMREHVASSRTLIFCSHLLDEVEKACDMVLVLDKGRVAFHGPIAEMAAQDEPVVRIGCADERQALSILATVPCVKEARADRAASIIAVLRHGSDPLRCVAEINQSLVDARLAVHSIAPEVPSLEDWFIRLTRPQEASSARPGSEQPGAAQADREHDGSANHGLPGRPHGIEEG